MLERIPGHDRWLDPPDAKPEPHVFDTCHRCEKMTWHKYNPVAEMYECEEAVFRGEPVELHRIPIDGEE